MSRISVKVWGGSPEIRSSTAAFVLIPGIGMSHRYFVPLARVLTRYGPVYVVDLPGFGDSRGAAGGASIADLAAVVSDELDRHDAVRPSVLVGHSMGCQVTVEMVRSRGASVDRLVLLAPVVNPRERSPLALTGRLLQDLTMESMALNATIATDYLRCRQRSFFGVFRQMTAYRIEQRIQQVNLPVRVVRGTRDPLVPLDWARELADSCAGAADVREIPREGHCLMYRSPEQVAEHCI